VSVAVAPLQRILSASVLVIVGFTGLLHVGTVQLNPTVLENPYIEQPSVFVPLATASARDCVSANTARYCTKPISALL